MLSNFKKLSLLIPLFLSLYSSNFSQGSPTILEIGKPIEAELKRGETHEFRFVLSANEFIYLSVAQKGIDVTLTLVDPDGKRVTKVDSPNGTAGFEPLWAISKISGEYILQIMPGDSNARAGRYEVKFVEKRSSKEEDLPFVLGMNRIDEGMELLNAGGDSRKDAEAKFESAGTLFESVQDKEQKGKGFFRLADTFSSSRNAAKALHFFKLSIPLLVGSGNKSEAGRAYFYIGRLVSDPDERVAFSNNAVILAREAKDEDLEADSLLDIGNWRRFTGDFPESLESYQAALAISQRQGNFARASITQGNISGVYTKLGDYRSAVNYQLDSMQSWAKVSPNPRALSLMTLGVIYGEMENYELSREYSEKAITQFTKIGDKMAAAIAISNIGLTYFDQGDVKTGLTYTEEVLKRMDEMKSYQPDIYCDLARAQQILGSVELAYKYATQCLKWNRSIRNKFSEVNALLQIGELEILRQQPLKALEFGDQAEKTADQFVYPKLKNSALSLKALALSKLGRTADAKQTAEMAVRSVESLRLNVLNDSGQVNFLTSNFRPFHLLIENEIRSSNNSGAWSVAERMKARRLLEVLSRQPSTTYRGLGLGEREAENNLRKDMNTLNRRLRSELDRQKQDETLIAELRKKLDEKRLRMEEITTQKYARYPELRLYQGEMNLISTVEIASQIPSNQTAIMEFVVAEQETHIFVVTKDKDQKPVFNVISIGIKDNDLAEQVEHYRSKMGSGDLDFQKASRELYDLLLKPAAAQLAGKANIIIVPDGPLWNLPFQALVDDKGKYLIEKAAVSYAPSLTALREMSKKAKARKSDAGMELVAFGNPIVGKETAERVQRVFMSEKLEPLPEAERLVNGLGKMYGPNRSKVYVGDQAREEIAKTESPKYRIVQFATHGILNNVSPMYSHLVLAQNQKDLNEDGLLEAWEMKDLYLKADMVVLSACDTARGKISNGEGVIGMTWAMFIAGAPTTVASQWKVESSSTTDLMLEFHRQMLTRKVSKAEALRQAELKLLHTPKYKHPSYWGGWVLVGDGN